MKKTLLISVLFAAVLVCGAWACLEGNFAIEWAAAACVIIACLTFSDKQEYSFSPEEQKKFLNFLFTAAIALIAVRFFRILSFPYDFYADELNEPTLAYWKISGDLGAFDYSKRLGTALPYVTEAVYALYFLIFKNHIEFLRTAPLLAAVASAIELYFLGKLLKDRAFGIILVFVYAVSGWTLFTSRELMVIVYLPFLAISFLLLFFIFLNNRKVKYFLGAGLVFFAGFFTYSAWVIMIPFAAYLAYEYRQELGEGRTKAAVMFLVASVSAAGLIYLSNDNIIKWALGRTVLERGNFFAGIIMNTRQIFEFFLLPVATSNWFTDRFAVLNFTELVMFGGGLALCVKNFRDKTHRIFLAGLLMSLFTLLISNGIDHHLRHIMIMPFLIIISGLFMHKIISCRHSAYIAVVSVLLFVNVVFYMFLDWNRQITTTSTDIAIAGYINKNYGANDSLLMHETIPYGIYPVYLRTKAAYNRPGEDKIKTVIFVSMSPLRNFVKAVFPGVKMKYFYVNSGDRFPVVVYAIDVSANPDLRKYFYETALALRKLNVELWGLEYDAVIKGCGDRLIRTKNNGLYILTNTFFRYTEFEALGRQLKGKETMEGILNREKPMFVTSDWYFHIAKVYYAQGENSKAIYALKRACETMPEWKAPYRVLDYIAESGGNIKPEK